MPASDYSSSSQPRPVVSTCPHHSAPCLRVGRPRATAPPRQRGPVPVVGVLSLPPGDCPPCVYREYLLSTDVQDMNLHLFILLCTIDSCMHLLSSLHHSSPSPPSICPVTR